MNFKLLVFGTVCIIILLFSLKYFIRQFQAYLLTLKLIEKEGRFTCSKRGGQGSSAQLRTLKDSKEDEKIYTLKDSRGYYNFNKFFTMGAHLLLILLFTGMLTGMIFWLNVMIQK